MVALASRPSALWPCRPGRSHRGDAEARLMPPSLQQVVRCGLEKEDRMKFMVTWSVRPDLLKPAVTRFLSNGSPVPQGVKSLGRWHKADGSGGFHLMETDDLKGV